MKKNRRKKRRSNVYSRSYNIVIIIVMINVMVFLHNYCSDDIDINMKSYILYIMYSTHL